MSAAAAPIRAARTTPSSKAIGAESRPGLNQRAVSRALCWGPALPRRARSSVQVALREPVVRVDPPVAQERPSPASRLDLLEVAVDDEDLLALAGLRRHDAHRLGDERVAPELQLPFGADAVDGDDEAAVGDGVAALDGVPGLVLDVLVLHLAKPGADGGGIEQDVRALHGGEARGLRVPLVPADEGADAAEAGVERLEAKVARSEVELLVEARVVGDVHLAVLAQQGAVRVDDDGGVVV